MHESDVLSIVRVGMLGNMQSVRAVPRFQASSQSDLYIHNSQSSRMRAGPKEVVLFNQSSELVSSRLDPSSLILIVGHSMHLLEEAFPWAGLGE